jgi:aryl-alcohol dehydrogenase-like predicted oxidoreductase
MDQKGNESMSQSSRVWVTRDYSISRLIVGGWQFSRGHGAQRDGGLQGREFFARLVDAGLTTFDCADIYEGVEELLGEFLSDHRRCGHPTPVQVHTKFVPDLEVLPTIDKAYVERIVHRSLARLGVERLDLVQFHWWDFAVPGFVDVAGWLTGLQADGKIRHLAVTNFDAEHLEALTSADVPVVSNQVQYSLLDRRPGRDLGASCRQHGIVLLCYGALAGGFLTDGFLEVESPPETLANRSLTKYRLIIDEIGGWSAFRSLLGVLRIVARKHRTATACVALRWVLDQEGVAATITGMDTMAHARQLLQVFRLSFDEEDREMIGAALEGIGVPDGPVYGLERDRDGPHGRIMRYNLNRE